MVSLIIGYQKKVSISFPYREKIGFDSKKPSIEIFEKSNFSVTRNIGVFSTNTNILKIPVNTNKNKGFLGINGKNNVHLKLPMQT